MHETAISSRVDGSGTRARSGAAPPPRAKTSRESLAGGAVPVSRSLNSLKVILRSTLLGSKAGKVKSNGFPIQRCGPVSRSGALSPQRPCRHPATFSQPPASRCRGQRHPGHLPEALLLNGYGGDIHRRRGRVRRPRSGGLLFLPRSAFAPRMSASQVFSEHRAVDRL